MGDLTIRDLTEKIREVNLANGWRTEPPEGGMTDRLIATLALITTEVTEAIEEVRNGHLAHEARYPHHTPGCAYSDWRLFNVGEAPPACTCTPKPEGVPSELADIIIRTLDFADQYGVDIEAALVEKVAYNAQRGFRHGGKAL